MRTIIQLIGCTILAAGIAGCATNQVGPARPITIDEEVAWVRDLLEHDLASFYGADPTTQAYIRNEIVTARMYIADMEYNYYEARLTREMQDEGLLATATELGLTTAATLVPVAQTKTLLSALATGVVGLDKAYTEKELLSNTIQALQTQMRADRKTEAGEIYGKMYRDTGNNTRKITSIAEYTLPMALSDADAYYHAGTISSSLIGLSKTVARAERNADQAKISTGPNPEVVSTVKEIAAPQSAPLVPALRPFILPPSTARAFRESIPSSARAPLAGAGGQPGLTKSETIGHPQTEVEQRMPIPVGRQIQGNLCVSVPDGNFGAETREAIRQAKTAANASRVAKQAPPLFKSVNNQIDTEKESQIFLAVQQCELDRSGTDRAYATAFEKFRFADENAIKELQKTLAKCAPNANVTQTGIFDKATREGISAATGMKGSTVAKTNKLNETSYEWVSGVCI